MCLCTKSSASVLATLWHFIVQFLYCLIYISMIFTICFILLKNKLSFHFLDHCCPGPLGHQTPPIFLHRRRGQPHQRHCIAIQCIKKARTREAGAVESRGRACDRWRKVGGSQESNVAESAAGEHRWVMCYVVCAFFDSSHLDSPSRSFCFTFTDV